MKIKRSKLKEYIRDRVLKEERRQQALKILREAQRRNKDGSICIYGNPRK